MEDNNKVLIKLLNMSKIIFATLLLILVVLIIGVSKMYSTGEDAYNSGDSEYNTNYDVSMFKEITVKDIKKSTKGEKKVIYIGRESCGWCAAFLPNLWDAQEEYGFTTLYIDLAKIIDFSSGSISDQDSFDTLTKLTGKGYETYMADNLGTTPMILVVKDNKIINASTGYYEYEEFKSFLDDSDI